MSDAVINSLVRNAVDALRTGEMDRAAAILSSALEQGGASGNAFHDVSRLADHLGEIEIAIEASRRFAAARPDSIERQLGHWSVLSAFGRSAEAKAGIAAAPQSAREHPGVLLFLATRSAQAGEFEHGQELCRQAMAEAPLQSWSALANMKTFAEGDEDLAAMERLLPGLDSADPGLMARFLHGLAKAYDDCGETDRAWRYYESGAALRRRLEPWNPGPHLQYCESLIRDFTGEELARLTPVSDPARPALFVTGLPRSGTTLVEQILVSHSQVADGGEFNLLRASLIPTVDYTLVGALAFQQRFGPGDPWGKLAAGYFRMLQERFRSDELVVDKSTLQSYFMGLLLHMLPGARVLWLRRNPEDLALSCFRTSFSAPLPWSWSLEDIGQFLAMEDRLFAHWTAVFPERICVVPYEEMVREPDEWIPRIAAFAGLPMESQLFEFHRTKRNIRTASQRQVRSPISTSRVGSAGAYSKHMDPFRRAYAA